MTNQSTKDKFAEILAKAQAKAESQVAPKQVQKPTQVSQPIVQAPSTAPSTAPSLTARVVTRDNLIARYKAQPVPELSTMTIDDLVGEVVKPSAPKPSISIVHYSDKCVVVTGDTKPHKSTLKSLGGKFNPWLKCGEGWVFPKYKEAVIRAEFSL